MTAGNDIRWPVFIGNLGSHWLFAGCIHWSAEVWGTASELEWPPAWIWSWGKLHCCFLVIWEYELIYRKNRIQVKEIIGVLLYGDWISTHTQPFNGPFSRTMGVSQYQEKHSPTHTQGRRRVVQTTRSAFSQRGLLDPVKPAYNQLAGWISAVTIIELQHVLAISLYW